MDTLLPTNMSFCESASACTALGTQQSQRASTFYGMEGPCFRTNLRSTGYLYSVGQVCGLHASCMHQLLSYFGMQDEQRHSLWREHIRVRVRMHCISSLMNLGVCAHLHCTSSADSHQRMNVSARSLAVSGS
jgi:hypothetical protein